MPSNSKPTPNSSLLTPVVAWEFSAIGTSWWIGVYHSVDAEALTEVKKAVAARIEAFDKVYSRFRADSLVSQMAQAAGQYTLPEDAAPLLAWYRQLYDLTDGAVTPLAGQTLVQMGYDASYSLKPGEITAVPAWDEVMNYENGILTTQQPLILDVGAAGKGYLTDLVARVLTDHSVTAFCIDASGDLLARGLPQPLQIGLEHPNDSRLAIGSLPLQDGALCGSASNRRSWGEYHHIVDPRKGEPVHDIVATWVAAADGLHADGLATALFFIDAPTLQSAGDFTWVRVRADNTVEHSPNFTGEIFR